MSRIKELTDEIRKHRSGAKEAAEERRRLILEAALIDRRTPTEIAAAAGISRQAVSRITTGKPRSK